MHFLYFPELNKSQMKLKITILIVIIIFKTDIYSQSEPDIPYSSKFNTILKHIDEIPVERMKSFDLEKYKEEIKESRLEIFAKVFDVEFDIIKSGLKEKVEGGNIWRFALSSVGAYSINVTFSNFHLDSGCKIYLYDRYKKMVHGSFTDEYNPKNGFTSFACAPVPGQHIYIELFQPDNYQNSICIVGRLGHDFKGTFSGLQSTSGAGASLECQVDISCSEGNDWQKEADAVCKIIFNNNALCTGALVNNTNDDGTPYLLTADHCFSMGFFEEYEQTVNNSVFLFNNRRVTCNGIGQTGNFHHGGGTRVAHWQRTDFLLIELNNNVPTSVFPYYLGFKLYNPTSDGVCIHHPRGDFMKIATYNSPPGHVAQCLDITASWGDQEFLFNDHFYDIFFVSTPNGKSVTEPGSSGSPIIDSDKRVYGQLFGICEPPPHPHVINCSFQYPTMYGKLAVSWVGGGADENSLHFWLDPLNIINVNNYQYFGLRNIRYFTFTSNKTVRGDIVKFYQVFINVGVNIEVKDIQDRFEVNGEFSVPLGSTFQVD
jgi:hypothetical protein